MGGHDSTHAYGAGRCQEACRHSGRRTRRRLRRSAGWRRTVRAGAAESAGRRAREEPRSVFEGRVRDSSAHDVVVGGVAAHHPRAMTFLDSNVAFDAGVGQLPGDGEGIERRHGPHGVCFKVGPDHPGRPDERPGDGPRNDVARNSDRASLCGDGVLPAQVKPAWRTWRQSPAEPFLHCFFGPRPGAAKVPLHVARPVRRGAEPGFAADPAPRVTDVRPPRMQGSMAAWRRPTAGAGRPRRPCPVAPVGRRSRSTGRRSRAASGERRGGDMK